jgi:hypothetical protein
MFPDSEISKTYGCGRTKTTSIFNVLGNREKEKVVASLQNGPLSISTDGSNQSDSKLYLIVVTFHNSEKNQIQSYLLSVPVLEGDATGNNIGNLLLDNLKSNSIPLSILWL